MSNVELKFNPTSEQNFELEGRGKYDFVRHKRAIDNLVAEGEYAKACELRYEAFMALAEAMPEEEAMPLKWEHGNSHAALAILYGSAVDHFRIGDLEMTMAQLEMLLECDPEDHFEAVNLLALCYVATEEWELFDDMLIDLNDKSAEATIARLWAIYMREQRVDTALLAHLKSRHKGFYGELCLAEHPEDDHYLQDIASDRPTESAIAREWWLLTEPLWHEYPEFIAAIRG